MMRESHPYRRVSESENAACNLPVTSLKSHCSIVIHHLGGLVAFKGLEAAVFSAAFSVICPAVSCHSLNVTSIFDFILSDIYSFLLFLTALCFLKSSAFPRYHLLLLLLLPRLLSDPLAESAVAFIALLLLHLALSSSRVGGHTPSTV